MLPYKNQFSIREKKGNNALDYSKRKKLNSKLILNVPKIVSDKICNAETGKKICFEKVNENKLEKFFGLKYFIRQNKIRLMDNHNHAFYFWHEALKEKKISQNCTLIHIDAHKDTRIPSTFLKKNDVKNLQKVFDYTNNVLNVGNFIPPARQTGLLSKIFFITSEFEMEKFKEDIMNEYILDIDLDFFSEEMNYISKNKKINLIKKLIPKAKLITIATSPGFIEQNSALSILREIFKN